MQRLADLGLAVRVELRGDGLFPRPGPSAASAPLIPPTYMDDLAIPILAGDAMEILDSIRGAASALKATAAECGLRINFAAGKTECRVGGPSHAGGQGLDG